VENTPACRADTSSEAAGAIAVVGAAAAELSAENELPIPSSWVAAAAIAAGAVLTYAMYLSWWKAADPYGVGHSGQCRCVLESGVGSTGIPWRNLSTTAYRVNGFLTFGRNF
jgi:hypothetical protein